MALRLTVPASVSNPKPIPETRPKQLKDWLSGLPLTKLFESARIVCDELARLNRCRISADERLKLLEIYDITLQRLRAEIAEDYNKAPLPLPANSRKAVNLARELLIEESYAYKLALIEKTNKLMLFGGRKQLVPIVERVMLTLSNSLTLSYQSYLPTPAGVWHELHQLYRYAAQYRLIGEDREVEEGHAIDQIYKHSVLIALTDPYRLPRAELPDVIRVANEVASLIELNFEQAEGSQQPFVIRPDSDKPPKPVLQLSTDGERPASDWTVSTVHLMSRLWDVIVERESSLHLPSNKDGLHSAPLGLLQRLTNSWGAPHKRLFSRQAGQTTVHICVGIGRICKLLDSLGEASNYQLDQKMRTLIGDQLQEWDVINQSAGGFKLRGMPAMGTGISIGEVIAVQYRGISAISIGVVRWAQTFDDTSVEVGVQMLGPKGEAVTLEPTIGGNDPQRALLLPEIVALQQPACIVAATGNYQPDREFVLTQLKRIVTVRAGELVERSASYEIFRFVPA